jgi:hypothetical protein
VSAGVVTVGVFMSLNVTLADFPPMITFVPVWKPLPRSVMLVPPDAGPDAGDSVPIPEGTFANWITLKPEVEMANRRLESNMDLSSYKGEKSAEKAAPRFDPGRRLRRTTMR